MFSTQSRLQLNDIYYEIPTLSGINSKEIIDKFGHKEGWGEYYNFFAKPLPSEYLESDKFIKWLSKRHSLELILFYYPPYYIYNWHVDVRRGVTLNLLLNFDGKSNCIFCENEEHKESTLNFKELIYKPNTYFLFNTQVFHSVYNYDKPRYLIGCEFKDKKQELSFKKVRDEIINNYDPS